MKDPSDKGLPSDETAMSGRNVDYANLSEQPADITSAEPEFPTKIERSDIRPHPIERGHTELILQRHGKYIRDMDDPFFGSLPPEATNDEQNAAKAYFREFLEQFPKDEQDSVDVLFVASDTQYRDGGRRSYETAVIAQQAASEVFDQLNISSSNIINAPFSTETDGGPEMMSTMREPQMFSQSPDFVEFLREKYGDLNLDFWIAFEEDQEKETRLAMGAEGPDEIADRMAFSVQALAEYAEEYHKSHLGRRLIIWADTHYDTISPFVKRDVFGIGKDKGLLVDYGAGITIDIDENGRARTELGGTVHEVPLRKG